MGGSSYSHDDYAARSSLRSSVAKDKGISNFAATFAHDHDVKTGKATGVHVSLKPTNVIRECRDSATHPISVPIGLLLDTTGSMAEVPMMLQEKLTHLMGCFLNDKASGKKYLGEGYPAIITSAVDDFYAMHGEGTLQVGQFESGIEIDDNLTNLWITANGGGGEPRESYGLGMWFYGFRTVHDHFEKRGRKGYLFIIGDEKCYDSVTKAEIKSICGVDVQGDMPIAEVIAKVKETYNVFYIVPNMTNHYNDKYIQDYWVKALGQQNVIKLEDPGKICETIVSLVAILEENVTADDLGADLGVDTTALVALSKSGGAVARHSADNLPVVAGAAGGTERL